MSPSKTTLEDIAKLVCQLVGPVTEAMEEIKRSTHNRWLILTVQGIVSVLVCAACFYVLVEMQTVVHRLDTMRSHITIQQAETGLAKSQVEALYKLIETHTTNEDVLEDLQKLADQFEDPTPQMIQQAVQSSRGQVERALSVPEPSEPEDEE